MSDCGPDSSPREPRLLIAGDPLPVRLSRSRGMDSTRLARNASAAAVVGIAAWSSYSHMVHVALRFGEHPEVDRPSFGGVERRSERRPAASGTNYTLRPAWFRYVRIRRRHCQPTELIMIMRVNDDERPSHHSVHRDRGLDDVAGTDKLLYRVA